MPDVSSQCGADQVMTGWGATDDDPNIGDINWNEARGRCSTITPN